MAKKTNINVGLPSPIELARISAEQEKAEAIASAESKSSVIGQQSVIFPDVEKLRAMGQRPTRVTRTFTLSTDTEKRLKRAADMLGTNKSALLERAFNEWFNVVETLQKQSSATGK